MPGKRPKAVVLLSGGLDSATTLFLAESKGFDCRCLIFDYGQRHKKEISSARAVSRKAGSRFKVMKIALPWKGSSLLDRGAAIPMNRSFARIKKGIPSTYVPARNTIFLAYAMSYAEAIGAGRLFIGAHFQDSSGYPDCRSAYIKAFGRVAKLGTKSGLAEGLKICAPLVNKKKKDVIRLGHSLGVPFKLTRSCYCAGRSPCGKCDSCILRKKGFKEAGLNDPVSAAD
ncbi:7-cyano-7-deazaguanine synthase QueC [Candidatus Omnitrophota bacterium]